MADDALDALAIAREAYRVAHPRQADALDEAMARGVVDEDSETAGGVEGSTMPSLAARTRADAVSGQEVGLTAVSEQLPLAAVDEHYVYITLTQEEMWHAEWVAKVRQRLAEKEGRKHLYGFVGDGQKIHLDGCYSELAVARHLGLYWHALLDHEGRQTMADVGKDIEVRCCSDQHRQGRRGNLILHREDKDDRTYVLVDGEAPNLVLVGWKTGVAGKREEWWRADYERPAYFVPREELLWLSLL